MLTTGCTQTRTLNAADGPGLNRVLEGRETVVVLENGRRFTTTSARMEADTLTWIEPRTGEVQAAPLHEVRSLVRILRGRGALQGAGIGASVGFVGGAGAMLISLAGADEVFVSPAYLAVFAGGIGAGIGGGLGAIAGNGLGSRVRYEQPAGGRTTSYTAGAAGCVPTTALVVRRSLTTLNRVACQP